jgi:hypothetical protein
MFEVGLEWWRGAGQVFIYALIALLILKLMTKIGGDND